MCKLAFKTAECCCLFDRPTGARLIGLLHVILFFFGVFGPIVELNKYRKGGTDIPDVDDQSGPKVVEDKKATVFKLMRTRDRDQ